MKRRTAREFAVQSLYQLEMNEASTPRNAVQAVLDSEDENETVHTGHALDVSFVLELIEGVLAHKQDIDTVVEKYLNKWKVNRLSKVDKQILRLAVYEIIYVEDVPEKVAVNEAIELAKHFGTMESGKFVNGVLGTMLNEVSEIKASLLK